MSARERMRAALGVAALAAVAVLGGAEAALATTDTTFDAPLDTVTDMVAGTGGQPGMLADSLGLLGAEFAVEEGRSRFVGGKAGIVHGSSLF